MVSKQITRFLIMKSDLLQYLEENNNITGRFTDFIEYVKSLEDDSDKLAALENGGVDNWEWYSESLQEYWKEKEDEE